MLGDELRKARDKSELTQEELSFAAKIDRAYIEPARKQQKVAHG